MIHAYYATEFGADDAGLWATNHGNEPFEGAVTIPLDGIVAAVTRHQGAREVRAVGPDFKSNDLPGATDDTWICDFFLSSGDHIWLYGATIDEADTAYDTWLAARRAEEARKL